MLLCVARASNNLYLTVLWTSGSCAIRVESNATLVLVSVYDDCVMLCAWCWDHALLRMNCKAHKSRVGLKRLYCRLERISQACDTAIEETVW